MQVAPRVAYGLFSFLHSLFPCSAPSCFVREFVERLQPRNSQIKCTSTLTFWSFKVCLHRRAEEEAIHQPGTRSHQNQQELKILCSLGHSLQPARSKETQVNSLPFAGGLPGATLLARGFGVGDGDPLMSRAAVWSLLDKWPLQEPSFWAVLRDNLETEVVTERSSLMQTSGRRTR